MSTMSEDLTFNKGDVITVIKEDGEWWTGTKDGHSGTFPANYVKKLPPAAKVTATETYTDQNRDHLIFLLMGIMFLCMLICTRDSLKSYERILWRNFWSDRVWPNNRVAVRVFSDM